MNKKRLKLIVCDVLMREVCLLIAKSPHIFDLEFTERDSHNRSDHLRKMLQDKIDDSVDKKFDAILLGYGLCGNATIGLEARDTPVVIPRAHDCCTLFLGSKKRFQEHFEDNPSQPFSSPGYTERSDSPFHESLLRGDMEKDPKYIEYTEKFGKENAKYIYETMYGNTSVHKKLIYIEIPETKNDGYADLCRKRAADVGMELVSLEGSLDLLRNLIDGDWKAEDFLVVNPGQKTVGVYDWERILESGDITD